MALLAFQTLPGGMATVQVKGEEPTDSLRLGGQSIYTL